MTKPQFRQINTADVSDEVIDLISDSMNVPTLVKPDAAVPTVRQGDSKMSRQKDSSTARRDDSSTARQTVAGTSRATGADKPSPQTKLTIRLPQSLNDRMKRDALDQKTTVRCIILKSLRAAGYEIADADLAPGAGGNC